MTATRRYRAGRAAATLGVLAVAASACASVVSGAPVAANGAGHTNGSLASLLPDTAVFPARYSAVVLQPHAAADAAQDLTGVAAGASVTPRECTPPAQDYSPHGTAVIVGTDNATRSTITVELVRTTQPLAERADQLRKCPTVSVRKNGTTATLSSELLPPPPIDADDTLAVRQTLASGTAARPLRQSMLTLLAQIDDVRIQTTYMTFAPGSPDTEALDQVFTDAVHKVRHG